MPSYQLAISNIAWQKDDDETVYAAMQQADFTGLELAPTRIFSEAPYENLTSALLFGGYLKNRWGFSVPSLQSIWYGQKGNIFDPADTEHLLDYTAQAFQFAHSLNCPSLVFGCPKNRMRPLGANDAAAEAFFMQAGNLAARYGVHLALGRSVEGFEERDGGIDVLVAGEEPLRADMVVLAIGVTPDTALAEATGLETGIKGSIVVNDRMETGVEDIYAVGDAVQISHLVTGDDALISLAGPANKQGRVAADVICGLNSRFAGAQGTSVIKVFDLTAAATGLSEAACERAGIAHDAEGMARAVHETYRHAAGWEVFPDWGPDYSYYIDAWRARAQAWYDEWKAANPGQKRIHESGSMKGREVTIRTK